MSNSADEIRSDIERTRQDLGMDVDALADKVTPSKIVDRQMGKVRGAFGSMRDRVMAAADDAGSSMADAGAHAGDVKDRVVGGAQHAVAHRAEGSPHLAHLPVDDLRRGDLVCQGVDVHAEVLTGPLDVRADLIG